LVPTQFTGTSSQRSVIRHVELLPLAGRVTQTSAI
jgi:hypothetical protein